jgi:hypothetical protein
LDLVKFYSEGKQRLLQDGYGDDIQWFVDLPQRDPDSFDERFVMVETTWVEYGVRQNISVLDRKWPRIREAYKDFLVDSIMVNEEECRNAALRVGIYNETIKVKCALLNAREIKKIAGSMSIGDFIASSRAMSDPQVMSTLRSHFRGIGPANVNQLARNLGIASREKPDSHLIDTARRWGRSVAHLVDEIERGTGDQRGVIDVILWLLDMRSRPPPGLTKRKHAYLGY